MSAENWMCSFSLPQKAKTQAGEQKIPPLPSDKSQLDSYQKTADCHPLLLQTTPVGGFIQVIYLSKRCNTTM